MKILIVLPRFPYPLEKGDKLRAFNQVRYLSELGNEIYLFCVSHTAVEEKHVDVLRQYCKEVQVVRLPIVGRYYYMMRNFMSTKSVQIGYWDSKRSRKAYKAFEAKVQPDVIYSQMLRTMPLVARSPLPKVMDFQDALSLNMERRMNACRLKGLRHAAYHFEFKMLRSTEYLSFGVFDDLTIISEPDSEAIPHRKNGEIKIVPNGVDFDYFAPMDTEKDYDVVFCGNMQYQPNVQTSVYLAEKVMPLVWKELPNARLMLAGATPVKRVRGLASERVLVTGSVKDIRQCYANARIFAAPMISGSGLQNKLLEAMAMQLPCITSSIANEALKANDGTEVLVGNDAQQVADHIIALLKDEVRRNTLAANGYAFVRKNYDWKRFAQQLNGILEQAVKNHKINNRI